MKPTPVRLIVNEGERGSPRTSRRPRQPLAPPVALSASEKDVDVHFYIDINIDEAATLVTAVPSCPEVRLYSHDASPSRRSTRHSEFPNVMFSIATGWG